MKQSLFSFALCLLLCGVIDAQSSRKRVDDGVRGPVRSFRMEQAKLFEENGVYKEGPRVLIVTKSYAEDWSWAEFVGYNADGSISQKTLTTYNENGHETSTSVFNGEGKLKSKLVKLYEDGKVVEEDRFDGDGALQQKRVLIYGDEDARAEDDYYDGKGALIQRDVKTRDAQKTTWTTYDARGRVIREAVYCLNDGGHSKLEVTQYNADGTVAVKTVNEVDENSEWIRKQYNRGRVTGQTGEKREVDAYGNVTKMIYYAWDEAAGKFKPVAVSYSTITYSDTK